ncbi:Peroxisomal acyl-coenzyme A oxidase 1 [Glycine soja]
MVKIMECMVSLSSCERSLDDHLPLPGITVGDIGMKFGNGAYNSMDNGVLRFDYVWIPRNQMLMRVSQVTREGKYVQSSVPRQLVYGTMVNVRQTIVSDASIALSRAVCIATRYSAVRRQFRSKKGGLETQVIDYKTQQARLFPLLASACAFRFVGEWLKWLYMDVMKRLQTSDFSTLPEAHACTAGLKSLTTSATAYITIHYATYMMELRNAANYEVAMVTFAAVVSLSYLQSTFLPAHTKETTLCCFYSAVARHLIKTISQLGSRKKPVGTTSYIGRVEQLMQYHSDFQKAEDGLKPNAVLGAFEARAAKKVIGCAQNLSKFTNPEEGFQEFSVDLVEAAVAHCQLIVVSK